jgi:hypothetical protein
MKIEGVTNITTILECYVKKEVETIIKDRMSEYKAKLENEIVKEIPNIIVNISKVLRVDSDSENLVITIKNGLNLK